MLSLHHHIPTKLELTQLLDAALAGHTKAKEELDCASEVIVYGSVACGVHGPSSDVDILAVGDGTRVRTKILDLKFVEVGELTRPLWLGGELAGHVAAYGVWLRGEPDWLSAVFPSLWSRRRKTGRILRRLSDVYVRRKVLSSKHIERYLERVLLDILRLERLTEEKPIPSSSELMSFAIQDGFRVVERLPALIGEAPRVMLREILPRETREMSTVLRERFDEAWTLKLMRDQAWRVGR